jgi:hypothetical protein
MFQKIIPASLVETVSLGRVGFFLSLLLRFLFSPFCETENVPYPRRSIGKHKKRQNLKDDDRAIGVETSFSLSQLVLI